MGARVEMEWDREEEEEGEKEEGEEEGDGVMVILPGRSKLSKPQASLNHPEKR